MTTTMEKIFGKFMKYQIETGIDLLPLLQLMEHMIPRLIKSTITHMVHLTQMVKTIHIFTPYM